jgi:hypothetical protein
MPIDFPIDPGLTPSYQYTYNGITQNWIWGASQQVGGVTGPEAWISQGFTITSAAEGAPGEQGFQGFQGIIGPTGVQGFQGNQGRQGPGNVLEVVVNSVSYPDTILLGFTSSDGSVSLSVAEVGAEGETRLNITAGAGGGANPEGPEGSVQFADGSSLSGVAEARIVTVNNINNQRGFSGNFVYYTESTTGNSAVISDNTTISVPFGTRNIYVVDNIALGANKTLTFGGFTGSRTGASMTLVLGYTGESTSTIVFPGNQGIYWAEGPFGVTTGSDAKIYPRTSPKKFDILYFFADGTRIYGNAQKDFKTSR